MTRKGVGKNRRDEVGCCEIDRQCLENQCCNTASAVYVLIINWLMAIIGVITIAVAAYAGKESYVTQQPLITGLIVLGVFLVLISVIGGFAIFLKSQALLSIYILLMTLFFICHFSVSVAVVAASNDQEYEACKAGWCALDESQQIAIQNHWNCATFDGFNTTIDPSCNKATNMSVVPDACKAPNECAGCYSNLEAQIRDARLLAGGVSLALCFFELLAISFALHYRRASKMAWAKERGYTREML